MKKKLFLIRYTYRNKDKEQDISHYNDQHYLCNELIDALNDIHTKYEGFVINIIQVEEINYTETV